MGRAAHRTCEQMRDPALRWIMGGHTSWSGCGRRGTWERAEQEVCEGELRAGDGSRTLDLLAWTRRKPGLARSYLWMRSATPSLLRARTLVASSGRRER